MRDKDRRVKTPVGRHSYRMSMNRGWLKFVAARFEERTTRLRVLNPHLLNLYSMRSSD
jgi:hypothetical protein